MLKVGEVVVDDFKAHIALFDELDDLVGIVGPPRGFLSRYTQLKLQVIQLCMSTLLYLLGVVPGLVQFLEKLILLSQCLL